jgi:hypothetical protein
MLQPGTATRLIGQPAGSLPFPFTGSLVEYAGELKPLSLIYQTNSGGRTKGQFIPKRLFLIPSIARSYPFSTIDSEGGAAFLQSSNGSEQFVFKEELCCYPKVGLTGRVQTSWGRSDFRYILPVLDNMRARGLNSEEPVCWLVTTCGHSFYGVRKVPGVTLEHFKFHSPKLIPEIAFSVGRELSRFHSCGVIHGHPHSRNILVADRAATFIDAKAVTFESDYPHTFLSGRGRMITWDQERCIEMRQVAQWFRKNSDRGEIEFMQGVRTQTTSCS